MNTKEVEFLQAHFSSLLKDLHSEIEKLNVKLKDFENKLYYEGLGAPIDEVYRDQINNLETQISDGKENEKTLRYHIINLEQIITKLKEQQKKVDKNYRESLSKVDQEVRELREEIEEKNHLLATLTTELVKFKNSRDIPIPILRQDSDLIPIKHPNTPSDFKKDKEVSESWASKMLSKRPSQPGKPFYKPFLPPLCNSNYLCQRPLVRSQLRIHQNMLGRNHSLLSSSTTLKS